MTNTMMRALKNPNVLVALAAIVAGVVTLTQYISDALPPTDGTVAVEKTMTVTGYCPCKICCEWKRTWYGRPIFSTGRNAGKAKRVGITASGARAKKGTIAADVAIPFGVRMDVPGYGRGVVQDRGGAIKGDHIDLFFKSHEEALRWGRQRLAVTLWLPENHPMVDNSLR